MKLTPGVIVISSVDGRYVISKKPKDMAIPAHLIRSIRKIVRFFSRQRRGRRVKLARITFSSEIEWAVELENGIDMVVTTRRSREETLLLIIHEFVHMVLKTSHDDVSRIQLGYRSQWKRYKDRDVYSEFISKQIFGRPLRWRKWQ